MANRAWPERNVAPLHRQCLSHVLEIRAAADVALRRRERDGEGEERVVDVHVGLRVRGVVLEYGHRMRAQLRAVADQPREERRKRWEERPLESAVEPCEHARHVLHPCLPNLVLSRTRGGQPATFSLGHRDDALALLPRTVQSQDKWKEQRRREGWQCKQKMHETRERVCTHLSREKWRLGDGQQRSCARRASLLAVIPHKKSVDTTLRIRFHAPQCSGAAPFSNVQ
eukprot:4357519-Pleurochrysis_carterae.AAC.1